MLSCSIWFSAPCFWMGGGLESSCVGRVHGTIRTLQHKGENVWMMTRQGSSHDLLSENISPFVCNICVISYSKERVC